MSEDYSGGMSMPRRNPFNPPPDSLPPPEVRFIELRVEPWPDGRKVRVHVSLTPFLKNPDLEMVITNQGGKEVSRVSIIENADDRFVFTMHLRISDESGIFTLSGTLLYQDIGKVDQRTISFEIQEDKSGNDSPE
jgi:hypothetical protein